MQQIIVRAETPEDVRAIDVVNLSAFQGEREAQLVEEVRRSSYFVPDLSLVAELNGRIVGHLLLVRAELRSNGAAKEVLALGPMSVVPSQSHRGIGSELVEAAVARAKPLGYGAIVVAGPPQYYHRLGFSPAERWGLRTNINVPEEAFSAMELQEGALDGGGEVDYPPMYSRLY
jgi:putative acetyltransferase